ncbi:hypothetical protein COBT_003353, partial [Conglomerata obtusa]
MNKKNSKDELSVLERINKINKFQENVMWDRRDKQKIKFNPIKHQNKINVGDMVHYKNFLRKDKLDPKWCGPFIVQSTNDVGTVVITDANGNKNIVAHHKDVKKIAKEKVYKQFLCDHQKDFDTENDMSSFLNPTKTLQKNQEGFNSPYRIKLKYDKDDEKQNDFDNKIKQNQLNLSTSQIEIKGLNKKEQNPEKLLSPISNQLKNSLLTKNEINEKNDLVNNELTVFEKKN